MQVRTSRSGRAIAPAGGQGFRLGLGRMLMAVCAIALFAGPAAAQAQYTPPPNTPGFEYIFDGSATGSDASFDKWEFASSSAAASISQNQWSLYEDEGAMAPNASPFGAFWYPVRPLGDATLKLKYTVEDTPTSTRNGGVMIRSPEVRYDGANNDAVLAQKPIGYSFEVCPGALLICDRLEPAPSETYFWEGKEGPYPPASDAGEGDPFIYEGPYCARGSGTVDPTFPNNVLRWNSSTILSANANNANNHRHWTQVYCGHEIQINETLTGGGPQPSSDARKTGSVYGFSDLNAVQSRTYERLEKGVWHDMEIRMIDQQFTILVDGVVINQFDNSVPRVASRNGDPPTHARLQPEGYIGFQAHGGNDRILYKDVEVRDYTPAEIPENIQNPQVAGNHQAGKRLTCTRGVWDAPGAQFAYDWYRSEDTSDHIRFRAPHQGDLGSFTTPPDTEVGSGTANLTWLDSLKVGSGRHYVLTEADVGKVIHCQVSATRNRATVFANGVADEIVSAIPANVTPPTLSGSGTVPTMLTCDRGEWTLGGPYQYAWTLDGDPVEIGTGAGQTGSTNPARYRTKASEVGLDVVCHVTRSNPHGASDPAASNAVTVNTG